MVWTFKNEWRVSVKEGFEHESVRKLPKTGADQDENKLGEISRRKKIRDEERKRCCGKRERNKEAWLSDGSPKVETA
jgi:hypothetical protein